MEADGDTFWEASLPAPRVPQDPAAIPSEATQPPKEKKAEKLQGRVIYWSFHVISCKKMEVSARKNGDNFAFTIGYPTKLGFYRQKIENMRIMRSSQQTWS
jgi:hypothetical protein